MGQSQTLQSTRRCPRRLPAARLALSGGIAACTRREHNARQRTPLFVRMLCVCVCVWSIRRRSAPSPLSHPAASLRSHCDSHRQSTKARTTRRSTAAPGQSAETRTLKSDERRRPRRCSSRASSRPSRIRSPRALNAECITDWRHSHTRTARKRNKRTMEASSRGRTHLHSGRSR